MPIQAGRHCRISLRSKQGTQFAELVQDFGGGAPDAVMLIPERERKIRRVFTRVALIGVEQFYQRRFQDFFHLGWGFTEKHMALLGNTISRKCAKMAPVLERYIADDILESAVTGEHGSRSNIDSEAIWSTYSLAIWLSASTHTP